MRGGLVIDSLQAVTRISEATSEEGGKLNDVVTVRKRRFQHRHNDIKIETRVSLSLSILNRGVCCVRDRNLSAGGLIIDCSQAVMLILKRTYACACLKPKEPF